MECIGRAKEKTLTEMKERERERCAHVRVGEGLLYKGKWNNLYPVKTGSLLNRSKMWCSHEPLVSPN